MGSLFLAAFVLAVVGGGIAYGGDRLGTYVGKKRISFKWMRISLRPRHTATLYTTFSGSAIAVLTLAALVSFDSAFKRALLEGPQLIADNRLYRDENSHYRNQVAAAERAAETADANRRQAQSRLEPIQQQLSGVRLSLGHSQEALQARQRQLSQAQARLADAQTGLGRTDQQLLVERGEVRQAKQDVVSAESNVLAARQKVTRLQQRLAALTVFGQGVEATNTKLQIKNAALKADAKRLEARTASSQKSLVFRTDQELGRLVVRAAQPVALIKNNLMSFLNDLGRTAAGRGAKEGVNDRAVVVSVPVSTDGNGYSPLSLVDEDKAVETLAQQVAARSSDTPGASIVIVARAVTNSFQGEQTPIRLQPYENVLIYHRGDEIATTLVKEGQTPLQIRDALASFLISQVRPAVLHQHLIPQTDPETGQPMIGSVMSEAAEEALVQQIQRLGGAVQVTAYASKDTFSGGPLLLRLGVAAVGPSLPAPPAVAVGGRS